MSDKYPLPSVRKTYLLEKLTVQLGYSAYFSYCNPLC